MEIEARSHEILRDMTTIGHPVPANDADDIEFITFALTVTSCPAFNEDHGERSEIRDRMWLRWEQADVLTSDLHELRTCLFVEARRHYHGSNGELFKDEKIVRALVDKIRDIAGGTVSSPAAGSEIVCDCWRITSAPR
ncbi:hypothetical protein AB0I35_31450 [Nocardia sp. NPDC050378]|uniref:hypothetical protein n=1 Tax=Nocardia sp. NPDC050378 TaxID=3155400 RepID=UPI0034115F42